MKVKDFLDVILERHRQAPHMNPLEIFFVPSIQHLPLAVPAVDAMNMNFAILFSAHRNISL